MTKSTVQWRTHVMHQRQRDNASYLNIRLSAPLIQRLTSHTFSDSWQPVNISQLCVHSFTQHQTRGNVRLERGRRAKEKPRSLWGGFFSSDFNAGAFVCEGCSSTLICQRDWCCDRVAPRGGPEVIVSGWSLIGVILHWPEGGTR